MISLRSTSAANPGRVRSSTPRGSQRVAGNGFTLLELVITVTILTILTLGAVPLARTGVQRQKEQQLRETLREMRIAIDQFHREAIAAPLTPPTTGGPPTNPANPPANPTVNPLALDPRVRVYVSDQTIFTVDNSDRYPPTLELLSEGVDVLPFATPQQLLGGQGLGGSKPLSEQQPPVAKKKFYLRSIPIDPATGEASWEIRSCYQSPDDTSWDGINVFDVHSKSKGTALNGEKYSDW